MHTVAAVPALGLLAGSAAGLLCSELPPAAVWIAVWLCTGLAIRAWRMDDRRLLPAAVALAFCGGGSLLAAHAWERAWRPSLRTAFEELARAERAEAEAAGRRVSAEPTAVMTVVGRLRQDAALTPAGVSLSVAVDEIAAPDARHVAGGVRLTVAGGMALERMGEWRAGRRIRAAAPLRRPSRYLNPGAPDEERALARRGAILVGTVKSGALVEVLARGSLFAESAARVRAFVRRTVAASVGRWSARAAAIVTAIVIGDRAGLGQELETRLQEAGTYHVVAISGGNIAILTGLTLLVFRLAGLLGPAAMLSAVAGLLAYAYVVGGSASVNRATLMAVVYLAGRAIDLRGPPFNTLLVAAGLLAASDPLSVADPAFLLTFGATTGILAVGSWLPLQRVPRPLRLPATVLAASIAAEAMLMPVGALLFSRITFAGLVLNFIAIPAMALAQIAGMLTMVMALVSAQAAIWIGWLAYVGAEALVVSSGLVDWAPFVTWRVAPPAWPAIAIYYLALTALVVTRVIGIERSSAVFTTSVGGLTRTVAAGRFAGAAVCASAALWILAEPWAHLASRGDGRLHVTFIDVGQGDATLVRFPRGAAFLVDAGGLGGSSSFDVGDRVVSPLLRWAGVRRLDTLVLTHGDADHIGGAASLVHEFRPYAVWEGIPVPPFEPIRTLRESEQRRRSRWVNVQAADLMAIDGVEVEVHHPGLPDWERQEVRNDDSVVVELRWGDVSIVLPGDISREVERTIAPRFAATPLRILKVPHHGSLTSSGVEFIRALQPRAAIVSAGRSNPFGHPAPAVMRRYQHAGAEIFRTDQDGAVMLETDGRAVRIETFTGRERVLRTTKPRRHEG